MTLSDLAWFTVAALTTGNGFLWAAWRRAEASRMRWREIAWNATKECADHCTVMRAEMIDNGHEEP